MPATLEPRVMLQLATRSLLTTMRFSNGGAPLYCSSQTKVGVGVKHGGNLVLEEIRDYLAEDSLVCLNCHCT
jgi:hypothetical protein